MKREIKFKAWNSETKKMMLWSDIKRFGNLNNLISLSFVHIMQFVGRKDKNDVDVYNGDNVIINYGKWQNEPNGKTRRGVVEYDVKDCAFVVKIEKSEVRVSFSIITYIEVIGNIYE